MPGFRSLPRRGRVLRRLVLTASVAAAAACGGDEPVTTASGAETRTPDRYEVRGEVTSVPRPEGDVRGVFSIRHEAIDDFRGVDGEIWGMDAMTMPFKVADGVSLEGLDPGAKIRFTLEVDYFGEVPSQVTAIEVLPPETELAFRKAQPPAPTP